MITKTKRALIEGALSKELANLFLSYFSVNCKRVKNGEIGFCACNQPCSEKSLNKGDCDFHYQCQVGERCRSDSCPVEMKQQPGFDSNTDCCQTANVGDDDFCTIDYPCEVDEGDCDGNDECRDDLICGLANCPNSLGLSSDVDCCEPKGCKLILIYLDIGTRFHINHHKSILFISFCELEHLLLS